MEYPYVTFSTAEKQRLIPKPAKDRISARRVLAMLASFGLLTAYALQVDLDAGISIMTNGTSRDLNGWDGRCSGSNATDKTRWARQFDWDEGLQALLQKSFFYGFILTQLPGGILATRREGAKHVIGLSILLTAVLSLVIPTATRTSVFLLVAVRALQGMCLGMTYPAVHALWGKWAPKYERSTWASFTYAGAMIGGAFTWASSRPLTGGLGDGWPWIYYITGGVACVWFTVWTLIVHSTPADHPRISKEEKKYIEESTGKTLNLPIPWRSILTSPSVCAICVCHFCGSWMFYTMLISVPEYLKSIYDIDVQEPFWWSAVPFLALALVMILMGYVTDVVQSKGNLSTANVRKMMTTIGMLVPAILLIVSVYLDCQRDRWVIGLQATAFTLYGFVYSGFYVNHLDIAPRFSGVLMGLSSTFAVIPAIIAPVLVEHLTDFSSSLSTWRAVFWINGCLVVFGCLVFICLGAGEELPWSKPPDDGQSKDQRRWNRRVDRWMVDSADLR